MITVRHYLTGNPDIEASRELLSFANSMTGMDMESFIGAFDEWYVQVQGCPERKGAGQEDEDFSLYETEAQKRISQHKKEHETPVDIL